MTGVPLPDSLDPTEFISGIAVVLPRSVSKERQRLLEHARAWSVVFYAGFIPAKTETQLRQLEAQWL